MFSRAQHFVTPWTVDRQASPVMEFSRQEYWSRLPFPSPGDLPNPGIKPGFPSLKPGSFLSESPGKSYHCVIPSCIESGPEHVIFFGQLEH